MLQFKNTFIVSILFIVILLLLQAPYYWFILISFIFLTICFWGSYFINSNFYTKTFCKGFTDKKQIAISFDDGIHSNTSKILTILDAHRTPATFFIIGKNIKGHENIVQQIHQAGHIIGNHSYSHSPYFDFNFSDKIIEEILKTQDLIYQIIGKKTQWFRPPYGVTTPHIAKATRILNYATIGWNIRSLDTVTNDQAILISRIKKQLKPGSILLLHDTCDITVSALPEIIQFVKNEGFEIVGLDQLLNLQPYV